MSSKVNDGLTAYQWTPQPAAEAVVRELIAEFLKRNSFAAELAERMTNQTGTRFGDWVEEVWSPAAGMSDRLAGAGFERQGERWLHKGGIFPAVSTGPWRAAVKVESVADFLSVWQKADAEIVGSPLAAIRRASVSRENDAELWVVERHGVRGFETRPVEAEKVLHHQEAFRRRRREFEDDAEGFALAGRLMDAAIADLGRGYTTDLFFAAEREYWQRKNRAARAQKARQDRLGLGWANHDHHTYRSSRKFFAPMIALFEKLGVVCRERFYAGADAGWGAQVMEHPDAGIVVFADVDLSVDELRGDFAHDGLADRRELGTVGLWCGLHGEAILHAGMHHLECQFDFAALTEQLQKDEDVKVMKPFTNFSFLRQAFTEGEIWKVSEQRIARLLSRGQITAEQAEKFRRDGAIGSHLENLERNEGFKGFNQTGVSNIIARTDPRSAGS